MFVYGIKLKCEGPFQVTDKERAYISKTRQGVVKWVHSNAFQRKIHNWDFNN